MIIGDCPYGCGDIHWVPIAPHCPAFSKEECDGCGKTYWVRHSRVLPEAFTEEEFAEKYVVDEKTRKITDRVEIK